MKVILFHRKPHSFHFSIEKIFREIRQGAPKSITIVDAVAPFFSQGFFQRWNIAQWARSNQGDVNHITGDIHFIALALQTSRTILTIHDLNFLNTDKRLTKFVLKLFWLILPLRNVSYITTVSAATKKDLLSRVKFPENRVFVIPDFVDPQLSYCPYTFNTARPRILQIGTKKNKNLERLIESLAGIPCHLRIVGQPDSRMTELLRENEVEYSWTGRLSEEELKAEYQNCDIVAFASTFEGFGMPILEAQAVGRPVVTGNISSMPEVAGKGACLVNPFNVFSIREGFQKVISDTSFRESIIKHGRNNLSRFELPRVAAMYYDLYSKVFAENNKV